MAPVLNLGITNCITDTVRTAYIGLSEGSGAAGGYYPAEGDGRPQKDQRFWGDFEASTTGSVSGWSAIEAKDNTAQFQIVDVAGGYPVRLGNKCLRAVVRSGDQYAATTGERCECTLLAGQGYPMTGTVKGQTGAIGLSVRPEGPWTHVPTWEIMHQIHADARFGQAPVRLQYNSSTGKWQWRLVTGLFPTSTDAANGTNPGLNRAIDMMDFDDDVWFDFRWEVKWTQDNTGYMIVEMKRATDSGWNRFYDESGIQTLPTYAGMGADTSIYQKLGYYRGPDASTQALYFDAYTVGVSLEDVDRFSYFPIVDRTTGVWPTRTQLHPNGSAETGNTTGWTAQSGAVLSASPTAVPGFPPGYDSQIPHSEYREAVFGRYTLYITLPGSSSSESAALSQALTPGQQYTYHLRVKVPNGFRARLNCVDGVSASLGTTSFTGDGTYHWVALTFTATANNNHSIRCGRIATGAAFSFEIDGAMLETGPTPGPYIETGITGVFGIPATPTRPAGQITASPTILDDGQGWAAFRIRKMDASTRVSNFFFWGTSDLELISGIWDGDNWAIYRQTGGVGAQAATTPSERVYNRGDYTTVIAAWDATTIKISVDGNSFTSVGNTQFPNLTSAPIYLGSAGPTIFPGRELGGDFLWAAFGTGSIDNAGAAILDGFRNDKPAASLLTPYSVTAVWDGTSSTMVEPEIVEIVPVPPAPTIDLRTEYAIIHTDLGGSLLGEIKPIDLSYGVYLDRPNSVSYSIPVGNRLANIAFTSPYSTDFQFFRNAELRMAGLITELETDLTGQMIQLSGSDWKHYFEKRHFPFDPENPDENPFAKVQVDTLTIMSQMLNVVLAETGSLDFDYSFGLSGVLTNFNIEAGDTEDILSKINGLASEKPGFDWVISPDRIIYAYPPQKGTIVDFPLEKGKNVTEIRLTNLGVRGSHVLGLGAGLSTKLGVLVSNPFVTRRYDYSFDYGDIIDKPRLRRLATRDLDSLSNLALQFSVACTPDVAPDLFANLAIGDTVPVIGDIQGYIYLNGQYRIIGVEGTVNAQGDELITLNMETPNAEV